jgi:hypothetical protein
MGLPSARFLANIPGVQKPPAAIPRPRPTLTLAALAAMLATLTLSGGRAAAETQRVSVQPLEGPSAGAVRQQIARMVRGHGFHVVTSIPRVDGTGQYLTLARDHQVSAFVTGDLEDHKTRNSITLLVWDGARGAVLARWSTSAPPRKLGKALARGFWKHLGPAIAKAQCPPPSEPPPAPPMHIDAGSEI